MQVHEKCKGNVRFHPCVKVQSFPTPEICTRQKLDGRVNAACARLCGVAIIRPRVAIAFSLTIGL